MTVRLYIDEDTSPVIAAAARGRGLDTVSAHEIGARGLEDEDQLRIASEQRRVIVSSNCKDFVRISEDMARSGATHAGIIVSYRQMAPHTAAKVADALARIASMYDADDLRDALLVLDGFWPTE